MENTQSAQGPALSGQVLFYKKPQPLSAEQHAGLGIKKIDQPFAFLREAHAIPLTVAEFGPASTSYPIIFVGEQRTPVAVMGVRQNENLFVTDDGRIEGDYYAPAFVRRYPFVFANDENQDRLLLCVDREAPMVTNKPEIPFFENGQPTEFTTNAIEFCKEFERHRRNTDELVKIIHEFNLFDQKTVSFQPRDSQGNESGPQQKIADYWAVDEQKLNDLSNDQANDLRERGAYAAIYCHMTSLNNWSRVINRAVRRTPQQVPVGQA